MAEAKARPKTTTSTAPGEEPAKTGLHVCPVAFCPIGLALSAVQQAGPDVMEHLLTAAREFLLAAKAAVDARAGDFEEDARPSRLERIEIA